MKSYTISASAPGKEAEKIKADERHLQGLGRLGMKHLDRAKCLTDAETRFACMLVKMIIGQVVWVDFGGTDCGGGRIFHRLSRGEVFVLIVLEKSRRDSPSIPNYVFDPTAGFEDLIVRSKRVKRPFALPNIT